MAETYSNLGNTLQELERFEEAEAIYNRSILIKPNISEVHSGLGRTLKVLGRLDEAEASFKQAIVLKPESPESYYRLGSTLQDLGKLDQAVFSFQKAFTKRTGISPVGDDILAPAPASLHFELTNKCNFHCTFCPSDLQTREIGSMDLN